MTTSQGTARTALPVLIVLALAALLGWFVVRDRWSPLSGGTGIVATGPGASGAAPSVGPSTQKATPDETAGSPPTAAPPAAAVERGTAADAGSGKLPSADKPQAQPGPSFDVVRVEPDGSSVVAGRAAPGSTVELRRNGAVIATGQVDSAGAFVLVPPPLNPGTHDLTLDAVSPDGARATSRQSVTAAIAANRTDRPLVTVTAPDLPTRILSDPAASQVANAATPRRAGAASAPAGSGPAGDPATAAGGNASADAAAGAPATGGAASNAAGPSRPLRIATVEAEGEGRLFVSGEATPGTTLRLYLNDTFVAPGKTGPDGRLSFDIGRGIRPGDYKVRLDEVDGTTGAVRSRAEVPFTVPAPSVIAAAPMPPASPQAGPATVVPPPSGTSDGAGRPADATSSAPQAATGATPPAGRADGGGGASPGVTGELSGRAALGSNSTTRNPATLPASDPGRVTVPEVATSIVSRGDSLWRISKRVYGAGLRYTVIYDANAPQIRDPDLIYPGQVFVLPTR